MRFCDSERLISVGDFCVTLLILLPRLPYVNSGAKSKPSLELATHKSPAGLGEVAQKSLHKTHSQGFWSKVDSHRLIGV